MNIKYGLSSIYLFCIGMQAQPDSLVAVHNILDTNNIKFTTMANGDMGWDYVGRTMRAPKDGETGYLYASSLWMASEDMYGDLYVAVNQYNQTGLDFWAGPFATNYDSDYDEKYNRSWIVSMDQIDEHRAHYANPNYNIPEVILNWPGNGNVLNGEGEQLAPFYDKNNNGIYEPESGDFPLIRGDKALFLMYNDDREAHANSGGEKIGVEVHMMLYAYDSVEPELDNSVFVHYEVFNRGTLNFYEFYVGMFNDWDLGMFNDDYIACDIDRNLSIVFNGDNFDEDGFANDSTYIFNGYGNNPPAAGLVSLNEEIYVHWYWNNNFDPKTGNPDDPEHYFNYLNALWKDGTTNSINSNPNFTGSIEIEDTTDLDLGNNIPSDRRTLHGIFIPSFLAGESFCLDFAYVYARNTTYSAKENTVLLMDYVDDVQVFYDDHFSSCTDHSADYNNLSVEEETVINEIDIIPGEGEYNWVLQDHSDFNKKYIVEVVNVLGQSIFTAEWNSENNLTVNLSNYSSGIYYLNVLKDGSLIQTNSLMK